MIFVLPGRPARAQSDVAEVQAAVERANSSAVWGEALRSGDPAPLATVWEGDPLTYFSGEVLAYRARDLRLLSAVVDLDFLSVDLLSDDRAVAETHEQWLDRLCTAAGELRGERHPEVQDRYELNWHDGTWWVSGVDVDLVGGSFDWDPAEDPESGPSPCAAVVS